MVRLELDRSPVGGDRLVVAVEGGEHQAEVVVELGFGRYACDGSLQPRQGLGGTPALVVDDAEVVQRVCVRGRGRQCREIVALGAVQIAAPVGRHRACHELVGRRRRDRSRRRGHDRAVALLVSPATPARTWIVAADAHSRRKRCLGLCEQRLRLRVGRHRRQHPLRDRDRRRPLAERDAVAEQLGELRRARDGVGESGHERGQSVRLHRAAEVEQAVEAERLAHRIGGLERKAIRECGIAKADAVLTLEQIAKRSADGDILGLVELDARVLQRIEQAPRAQREAAVAHVVPVRVPEPPCTEVIAVEECIHPRRGVDDVTVPLHEQHVGRGDVGRELLQHEPRVVVAGVEAPDRHQLDACRAHESGGKGIGQERDARKAHLRP